MTDLPWDDPNSHPLQDIIDFKTEAEKIYGESWEARKRRENEALTFGEKVRTVAVDKSSLKIKE